MLYTTKTITMKNFSNTKEDEYSKIHKKLKVILLKDQCNHNN